MRKWGNFVVSFNTESFILKLSPLSLFLVNLLFKSNDFMNELLYIRIFFAFLDKCSACLQNVTPCPHVSQTFY